MLSAFIATFLFAAGLWIIAIQRDRAQERYDQVISIINGACNANATAEDVRETILRAKRRGLLR